MSHTLTEAAASANFATGITVPDNGNAFPASCDVVVAALQQAADRTQALALAAPGATTKTLAIGLDAIINSSSRFTALITNPARYVYYSQSDVTSAGRIRFRLPPVGPGLKIIDITAYIDNATFGGGAHAGLPATLPILEAFRQTPSTSTCTSIGSQTDTSASQAAYDAAHTVVLTVNHTVLTGNDYYVDFTGETGANSSANKLSMVGVIFRVGQP